MFFKQLNAKQLAWRGVVISLIYNILWLLGFFYLIQAFESQMILVSLSFLFVYLFIAQPLKDRLYSLYYTRYVFDTSLEPSKLEQRVHSIQAVEDIYTFLADLVKQWKLPRLRFVLYQPAEKILFVSKSGHGKWIRFRKPENPLLVGELQQDQNGKNIKEFPKELTAYLQNRELKCLVPVVFRDVLLGFLGFTIELNRVRMRLAEYIAKRIALVIENDLLRQKMPRSEMMKKEFSLARRIESFLTHYEEIQSCGYYIRISEGNWQRKYFPALFEANITNYPSGFFEGLLNWSLNQFSSNENEEPAEKPLVLILCRLAKSAHRAKSLQLFTMQGYFISLSNQHTGLKKIVQAMQTMIEAQEAGRIHLEGFLLFCSPNANWEVQHFGSDLELEADGKRFALPETAPLGSADWRLKTSYYFRKPSDMKLSIRGYNLIDISKATNL